jgi:hypothetical protein
VDSSYLFPSVKEKFFSIKNLGGRFFSRFFSVSTCQRGIIWRVINRHRASTNSKQITFFRQKKSQCLPTQQEKTFRILRRQNPDDSGKFFFLNFFFSIFFSLYLFAAFVVVSKLCFEGPASRTTTRSRSNCFTTDKSSKGKKGRRPRRRGSGREGGGGKWREIFLVGQPGGKKRRADLRRNLRFPSFDHFHVLLTLSFLKLSLPPSSARPSPPPRPPHPPTRSLLRHAHSSTTPLVL